MKIEIKSWISGSILLEGDFSSFAEAVVSAVKNKTSLRGADLSGADLGGADLSGADLRDADLGDADLRDADLRGADLSDADLRDADLRDADLRDADLSDADLSGADLGGADLSGADLRDADLGDADLSGADLRDGIYKALPILKNPDRQILELIKKGEGKLEMRNWHACETTHCRAGWYVHMSGPAGQMLESAWGPAVAGALIFSKAYPGRKVPNFYASQGVALADIEANAAKSEEGITAAKPSTP